MKTLIIGGSHAALSLAADLRKLSPDAEIAVVSSDRGLPYQRPPLSKAFMSKKVTLEQILLRPDDWYETNKIGLRSGTTVKTIHRLAKTVDLSDGTVLTYDNLVLATGARPRRLPEAIGGNLENVFVMRDLEDALTLMDRMTEGARLVVIGGGYIGLEAASEAAKKGVTVTVVEAADRILKRVACTETADDVRTLHQSHGVRIFENASITRIVGENGKAIGLELSDGSFIAADFVVTGIGVFPDTALAEAAGLVVENGIVVNGRLETSDPSIYAIGDCASFPYKGTMIRLESVQNAHDMGIAAAENIMGGNVAYKPVPWFWSDQFDLKLQIAGLNIGYDHVISRPGAREGAKSHFYFRGDEFLAADCLNDGATYMICRRLLEGGKTLTRAQADDHSLSLKTLLS
ncbi:FAD-dependent oxidoreductase [Rhizobium sp. KVB221]|uniref:FAD-dependent oxidoreductase n=1 Tax=Rhizobium setariae TaxID=2801340 RepID=A0A936YQ00_9HYPH|nr:FAD-dependent oxidoreductase [Rhizobium setariae]MBL0372692.1 FAD-dependent oxidoreductase [Rhizobium setariae]